MPSIRNKLEMEAKRKPKENERDTDHEDCLSTHKVRLELTEAIFLLKKKSYYAVAKIFLPGGSDPQTGRKNDER